MFPYHDDIFKLLEIYMMHLENLLFQTDILIVHLCITWDNLNKGDAASVSDLDSVLLPSLKQVIRQVHPVELRRDYCIKEGLNWMT